MVQHVCVCVYIIPMKMFIGYGICKHNVYLSLTGLLNDIKRKLGDLGEKSNKIAFCNHFEKNSMIQCYMHIFKWICKPSWFITLFGIFFKKKELYKKYFC